MLFEEHEGVSSPAQIMAFEDSWHWDEPAKAALREARERGPQRLGDLLESLLPFLGHSDMMAYLSMMAVRLVELHRVLKPTGSIYLHCDEVAGHYLKVVMDAVFGPGRFVTEIVWQRTNVHSDSKCWSDVRDSILMYSKSDGFTWNPQHAPFGEAYIQAKYGHMDPDGRRYTPSDMRSPHPRPNLTYEWRGFAPHPNGWAYSRETMQRLHDEGRIWYPTKPDGTPDTSKRPRLKRYLDEQPGVLMGNIWTDIPPINSRARERLGYQTQKPEALLDRILRASSNEGDLVLDPFCGCGTTIAVAEKLHRRWIGIDITYLAIRLMKKRLRDTFGAALTPYRVVGEPQDVPGARALAEESDEGRHKFESWALELVGARPVHGRPKKRADKGVDGYIPFYDDDSGKAKKVIVQVKSGHVSLPVIQQLKGAMEEEHAQIGALVTLDPPTRPMIEAAHAAGDYEPPTLLPSAARVQIVTIEGLLDGTQQVEYPNIQPSAFKRARRQHKPRQVRG